MPFALPWVAWAYWVLFSAPPRNPFFSRWSASVSPGHPSFRSPYAILAGAIPATRMGLYMGVFNIFIVIPQVAMSLIIPHIYNTILGGDPRHVDMLGGAMLLVAAASVCIICDPGASVRISGSGH
jgi:hypothetical protein